MKLRLFIYKWRLPWMLRLNLAKWGFQITIWLGWIGMSLAINYREVTPIHSTTIDGELIEKWDETKVTTASTLVYSPNRNYVPGAVSYFRWRVAGKLLIHTPKWGKEQRWLWGEN
jgi:hypothetical protein